MIKDNLAGKIYAGIYTILTDATLAGTKFEPMILMCTALWPAELLL